MIKTQLLQFRKRLFSGKLYLQSPEGVRELVINEPVERWIVPRKHCLFYRHNLASVPEKQRTAALVNYLSLLSPFENFSYWSYWQGPDVLIWLWNKTPLVKIQDEYFSDSKIDEIQSIPESALTPQHQGGVFCYELENGYLAQYWHEGLLLGDYWWAATPSPSEWQYFLKSSGAVHAPMPKPVLLEFTTPVLWPVSVSWNERVRKLERSLMQSAAFVVIFLLLYFGLGTLRMMLNERSLEKELFVAEQQGQEIVGLREQAYQQRSQNQTFIELYEKGQLELMLEVAEALPASAGNIQRWLYNNKHLEVLLIDNSPNLPEYVGRLEAQNSLSSVTAEPASQGRQVLLKMEVN